MRDRLALLYITLFLSVINFFAKLGNDEMISPFVFGRTGSNQQALGLLQSSVALGLFMGSIVITLTKPARNKTKVVFISCVFVFSAKDTL